MVEKINLVDHVNDSILDEMNDDVREELTQSLTVNAEVVGSKLNGKQIGELLAGTVNTGVNGVEVGETVAGEHRYLQSQVFGSIVRPIIVNLASNDFDARNENCVRECRDICDKMGWDYEEVPAN